MIYQMFKKQLPFLINKLKRKRFRENVMHCFYFYFQPTVEEKEDDDAITEVNVGNFAQTIAEATETRSGTKFYFFLKKDLDSWK